MTELFVLAFFILILVIILTQSIGLSSPKRSKLPTMQRTSLNAPLKAPLSTQKFTNNVISDRPVIPKRKGVQFADQKHERVYSKSTGEIVTERIIDVKN